MAHNQDSSVDQEKAVSLRSVLRASVRRLVPAERGRNGTKVPCIDKVERIRECEVEASGEVMHGLGARG